jgi:hypothetical protein
LMRLLRFSTMTYVVRAPIGRTIARLDRLKTVSLILQNDFRYRTLSNQPTFILFRVMSSMVRGLPCKTTMEGRRCSRM